MLSFGVLITLVGMGAVFAFLFLLMESIKLMSFFVQKYENKALVATDKIAAVIAVALQGEKK